MVTFLSPLFLVGALTAAVPVILHLLKREPEPRIKFAAVRLLKRAPVENTEKHRLRELLLLALRIAALVLLALAFARPFFARGGAATASGVTVVALDTSFSLSAPGRFERARQLAKNAIANAPSTDLVGVVTFSDEAEIVAKPGSDRVLAASAVDEAAAGFGGTRYRAALSAASQTLAGRRGTIVVVTDLQESGWDAGDRASVPEGARIEIADVGALPANLAVVSMQPLGDRLVATIRNTGAQTRDVRAHLTIDGRPAGDTAASIGANQTAQVTFAGAPRGNTAAVTVDDPGGIQADNQRFAVLGGASVPSVAVVTGSGDAGRDAFYVQQALGAAAGGAGGYRAVGVSGAKLASMTDEQLAAHAAIFLMSTRGLERHGRELLASFVRSGGGMLVAAGPEVDGEVVADVLGSGSALRIQAATAPKGAERALAPADVRHPVFHAFAANAATLGLVRFRNAARIAGNGCQTIARFTTGDTALIDCAAGDGRALVIASDLDNRWNDFPLHATFVPFLHETVQYLASARAHASEYVVADAPRGAPRRPGIATIADGTRSGAAPRRVAINVDPRESDAARLTMDEFQAAVTRLKPIAGSEERIEARQQEDQQHMWQYAIALMLLALAVEGFLAARTA
jgi:hypothetical protein